MGKTSKLWLRYILLCTLSFAVLVGPLLGVLIANRERYFTTASDVVKVSIGGTLCMILVILLILGKLKVPSGLFLCAFVFLLSWLLEPVLKDLFLLSGCAVVGKAVDWIVVAPMVRRTRELIKARGNAKASSDITAEATARAMEDVLKKYMGRV